MRTVDEIVAAYHGRRRDLQPVYSVGATIQSIYDGDTNVSLPELDKNEKAAVANLLQTGIDQHAMRIASNLPVPYFAPVRTGREAAQRSMDRKACILGWWHANRMSLLLRRRARHLIALSTTPVVIRPREDGIPRWHIREPLNTYPAPGLNPDDIVPSDCIFTLRRSLRWLRANFDTTGLATGHASPDDLFDVLEYIDSEQLALVVLGRQEPGLPQLSGPASGNILAASTPNRAERPLAVVPGRITLGRLAGQFDQMVGMYFASAKLWGLHLHGVSRAIFGETWLQANQPGITPSIIREADPIAGETGIVDNGTIQQFRPAVGFQTIEALNLLERSQRLNGSVPAQMGGESPSNVRTAVRGADVMSAVVDFPIQEHQEVLAISLEEENRIGIALAKAYYPSMSVSFSVPGSRKKLTYTPDAIFTETDDHTVSYAYAGTDTNGLVITAGQRIGMETMSHERFMEIDPLIPDVDLEKDRILVEAIERAHLSGIQTGAADPNGPYQPRDLARLAQLIIEQNLPLYEAQMRLDEEIQARQAASQQGQLSPTEMQPGMSTPGAPGTLEAAAPVQGPQPSQQNLLQLLGALRLPQRQSPAELTAPVG